jgi:hypothetical protein
VSTVGKSVEAQAVSSILHQPYKHDLGGISKTLELELANQSGTKKSPSSDSPAKPQWFGSVSSLRLFYGLIMKKT